MVLTIMRGRCITLSGRKTILLSCLLLLLVTDRFGTNAAFDDGTRKPSIQTKKSTCPKSNIVIHKSSSRHGGGGHCRCRMLLKQLQQAILPPIPRQSNVELQSWTDQWKPQVIIQECCLGITTMLRSLPIRLVFALQLILWDDSSGSSTVGGVDFGFGSLYAFLQNAVLDAPILEEFEYRWIRQNLGQLSSTYNAVIAAWFCQRLGSPTRAIAVCDVYFTASGVLETAMEQHGWNCFQMFDFLGQLVNTLFRLRTRLYVYDAFNNRQASDVKATKVHQNGKNRSSFCSTWLNSQALLQRLVSRVPTCQQRDLRERLEQMIAWSARWNAAYQFGLAHGNGGIRKVVYVTISSLLIESRLAWNRKTIWGAIAAHATWNFFALLFSVMILLTPFFDFASLS